MPKLISILTLLLFTAVCTFVVSCTPAELTDREKRILQSLSRDQLQTPTQLSNRYANDPAARTFGEALFNDPRLSRNGNLSCASCHRHDKNFTDGLKKAQGISALNRNTPSLQNTAWQQWQYWDGRRDSLWSQALTPIESAAEMGGNRVATARLIANQPQYRTQYVNVFGTLDVSETELAGDATPMGNEAAKRAWYGIARPVQHKINTVFANVGKAIAAYEATLEAPRSRFDDFVDALSAADNDAYKLLTKSELQGLRLFINDKKTQCLECHNGPLFSNGDFHSVGSGTFTGDILDFGRTFGAQAVLLDEFNCHGRYSDASNEQCRHLNYMNRTDLEHTQGAFKTPILRSVVNTAPYFHDGRYDTLEQVVLHYAVPPMDNGQTDLRQFPLDEKEISALVAFLKTL